MWNADFIHIHTLSSSSAPVAMLADFVHVGLIADFGLLYWRAMREQGLGGVLSQQGVPLSFVDSV